MLNDLRLAVDVVDSKDVRAKVVFHVGAVWAVGAGVGLLPCVCSHVPCEPLLAGATAEDLTTHRA